MNKKGKRDLYSLEELVLTVIDKSKKLAALIDDEPELLEELQQIAIALHYTIQTLRFKLNLPNVPRTREAPIESSSDLRMTTKLPLKVRNNQKINSR